MRKVCAIVFSISLSMEKFDLCSALLPLAAVDVTTTNSINNKKTRTSRQYNCVLFIARKLVFVSKSIELAPIDFKMQAKDESSKNFSFTKLLPDYIRKCRMWF